MRSKYFNGYKYFSLLAAVIILTAIVSECSAQKLVNCYDSKGRAKAIGSTWTETYNGVTYDCVCDGKSGNGVTSTPRGSNGSTSSSLETDFRLMLVQSFLNFIFSDNTSTISDTEKLEKEKRIKEQQEELARINAENEKQRQLKEKLKQELHNKLMALYKMLPDSGSKLEQKTLTDSFDKKSFDGDSNAITYKTLDDMNAVDLRGKKGIVSDLKTEREKYKNNFEEWHKDFNEDVSKRMEKPDPYLSSIITSIESKTPPPLSANSLSFDDLKPGDVILFGREDVGYAINLVDNLLSWDFQSDASHSIIYLKEIAGQKVFLDNRPGSGERIITEKEFEETYKNRPRDVAQLISTPVKPEDGDKLYNIAFDLVGKEQQYKHDKLLKFIPGTTYGVWLQDMVCSESSRYVLVQSGFRLPESRDFYKKYFGVDYSLSDYYKSGYFFIRPMNSDK